MSYVLEAWSGMQSLLPRGAKRLMRSMKILGQRSLGQEGVGRLGKTGLTTKWPTWKDNQKAKLTLVRAEVSRDGEAGDGAVDLVVDQKTHIRLIPAGRASGMGVEGGL